MFLMLLKEENMARFLKVCVYAAMSNEILADSLRSSIDLAAPTLSVPLDLLLLEFWVFFDWTDVDNSMIVVILPLLNFGVLFYAMSYQTPPFVFGYKKSASTSVGRLTTLYHRKTACRQPCF